MSGKLEWTATGNSSTASRQVVDLINIKNFEKQYLENTVQCGGKFFRGK
jgi:hypothetical protein